MAEKPGIKQFNHINDPQALALQKRIEMITNNNSIVPTHGWAILYRTEMNFRKLRLETPTLNYLGISWVFLALPHTGSILSAKSASPQFFLFHLY